jgi:hypothetical protein
MISKEWVIFCIHIAFFIKKKQTNKQTNKEPITTKVVSLAPLMARCI